MNQRLYITTCHQVVFLRSHRYLNSSLSHLACHLSLYLKKRCFFVVLPVRGKLIFCEIIRQDALCIAPSVSPSIPK